MPLAALEGEVRPESAGEFHVHAVKEEEMRHANRYNGERAEALPKN